MSNEDTPIARRRRIAGAQAARVPVDHNGQPLGKPTVFEYDERGLLIRATPDPDSPDAA